MPTPGSDTRAPLILIVDHHEGSSRSLESVLTPSGYIVMRAFSAQSAFPRSPDLRPPDLVFISSTLPNDDGINLCQTLRSEPLFGASLPIIFTSPERLTQRERRRALRAGVWEIVSHPFDVTELLLKLEVYLRAKLEIDAARRRALVDEQTGLYNARGLERRATEMQHQTHRAQQALACVVLAFTGEEAGDGEADGLAAVRIAQTLKRVGRGSDAIGRLGLREFAVVAPSTNADGAAKLAHRLATAIRSAAAEEAAPSIRLRAGYDAIPNARDAPMAASDLLAHATVALRDARSNGDPDDWIQQFQY